MNKIIASFLIIFSFHNVYAQVEIVDTVEVTGFLVWKYSKKHIKAKYRETKKRLSPKGNSIEYGCGVSTPPTFYLQKKHWTKSRKLNLILSSNNSITKNEIYFPSMTCSTPFFSRIILEDYLHIWKKYNTKRLKVYNEVSFSLNKTPLIKVKGLKKYLFDIYQIRCKCLVIKFSTNDENIFKQLKKWGIDSCSSKLDIQRNQEYKLYRPLDIESSQSVVRFMIGTDIKLTKYFL